MSEFTATLNKPYKDKLFRIVFKEKKELLELYNALAGTYYQNPDELEVNTLEDVIYIHLKNDISFILDDCMNLYEHQSTFNPNMPLRGLFYLSDLYKEKFTGKHLYASKLIKLPTPQYIVFYNGEREMEDKVELRLSDAFMNRGKEPDIEVVAHMININYGHNMELMDKCKKLREYSLFLTKVKSYASLKEVYTREQAISKAIEECINEGILVDILQKERVRIMASILSEFDEVEYVKMLRQEGYEDGIEDKTRKIVRNMLKRNVPDEDICAFTECDKEFVESIRKSMAE